MQEGGRQQEGGTQKKETGKQPGALKAVGREWRRREIGGHTPSSLGAAFFFSWHASPNYIEKSLSRFEVFEAIAARQRKLFLYLPSETRPSLLVTFVSVANHRRRTYTRRLQTRGFAASARWCGGVSALAREATSARHCVPRVAVSLLSIYFVFPCSGCILAVRVFGPTAVDSAKKTNTLDTRYVHHTSVTSLSFLWMWHRKTFVVLGSSRNGEDFV